MTLSGASDFPLANNSTQHFPVCHQVGDFSKLHSGIRKARVPGSLLERLGGCLRQRFYDAYLTLRKPITAGRVVLKGGARYEDTGPTPLPDHTDFHQPGSP